jgi:hypothetical protein
MKKFNYEITIEAPSKELAEIIMRIICAQNEGVIESVKEKLSQEEIKPPPISPKAGKEDFLKGIVQVEKVIHIIKHCVQDETALDRIAQLLGIKVQPEKQPPL